MLCIVQFDNNPGSGCLLKYWPHERSILAVLFDAKIMVSLKYLSAK